MADEGSRDKMARLLQALLALCTKHARRLSRRLAMLPGSRVARFPPRKQLLSTLTDRRIPFIRRKKKAEEDTGGEGFGDGGLWRREILMGEKCQPLDFSGVIYYDADGRRLPEIPPRSPRAAPLQSSYSFPAVAS